MGTLTGLQRRVRERMVPLPELAARIPPGQSLLDLGCGHGTVLDLVYDRFARLVGVDYDARKAAHARARFEGRPKVRIVEGDLREYLSAQEDGAFSVVLLSDTLSSFAPPRQRQLLAETRRVLAPAGTLVIKILDTRPVWRYRLAAAISHAVYFARLSKSERQTINHQHSGVYERILREEGFERIESRPLSRARLPLIPNTVLVAVKGAR